MSETVGPEEVRAAAKACRETLSSLVDRDWSILAGGLEWSCRQTLEHIPNTQLSYASQLAFQHKERLPRAIGGAERLTVEELVLSVEVNAAILEHVLMAAPASARSYHSAGMADPSGFAAMGCDEILIHTFDIAGGFGIDYRPPEDLSGRVLDRLFPWAKTEVGAKVDAGNWDQLLWANGRKDLPGVTSQDETWRWHCAPLSEWDGKIGRQE